MLRLQVQGNRLEGVGADMVSKYKAELIEREYVHRMLDETFDYIKKMNVNNLADIPECIRDVILHTIALEVVACRICQLAEWN